MDVSVGAALIALYGAVLVAFVGFLLNNRGPKYERDVTKAELEILKLMKDVGLATDTFTHLEGIISARVQSWSVRVGSRYWRGVGILFGSGIAIEFGATAIQAGRPEMSTVTEQMSEYAVILIYASSILVIAWPVRLVLVYVRNWRRAAVPKRPKRRASRPIQLDEDSSSGSVD